MLIKEKKKRWKGRSVLLISHLQETIDDDGPFLNPLLFHFEGQQELFGTK